MGQRETNEQYFQNQYGQNLQEDFFENNPNLGGVSAGASQ